MKISKLFHWLYASLMLLPLVVFGVTGLYYGLNQSAQLSETTIDTLEYYNTSDSGTDYFVGEFENDTIYQCNYATYNTNVDSQELVCEYVAPIFNWYPQSNNLDYYAIKIEFINNDLQWLLITPSITYYNDAIQDGYAFLFICSDVGILDTWIDNYFDEFECCGSEISIPKNSVSSITNTNDISTSIINAWNSTWQNPLFSWSSDSFLIAPFNYITDLFSIPQNNTFSMALSYWLAISIVYLVFDLVMYVPLLAHRWIDKGMVE